MEYEKSSRILHDTKKYTQSLNNNRDYFEHESTRIIKWLIMINQPKNDIRYKYYNEFDSRRKLEKFLFG